MRLLDHLSDHFRLYELTRSQLAARYGLANRPDEAAIQNLQHLCQSVLEPVRAEFKTPIHPTSGFRSPAVNRLLGSSDASQHCKGEAVDFELAGVANLTLAAWIEQTLDFDQLIFGISTGR